MYTYVHTETGSIYEIDKIRKRWRRTATTSESGPVRRDGEWIDYDSIDIRFGHRMQIVCQPLPESAPGTIGRLIDTSPVLRIVFDMITPAPVTR